MEVVHELFRKASPGVLTTMGIVDSKEVTCLHSGQSTYLLNLHNDIIFVRSIITRSTYSVYKHVGSICLETLL